MTQYRLGTMGVLIVLLLTTWVMEVPAQALDRTVLPIQLPKRPLYSEVDARNAAPPPRVEPVAPEGALPA